MTGTGARKTLGVSMPKYKVHALPIINNIFKKEVFAMITKGYMINELKKNGVRKGEKDGSVVQLEHLKTCQIARLYNEHCKK